MKQVELLVIGGGAAGISAAAAAAEQGCQVLLAEGGPRLGGVLDQCSHRGFGSGLTGPEYAERLTARLEASTAEVWTGTHVLRITSDRTALLSGREGLREVGFGRCILAAGCYERTIGSLPAAGTRPAGVFTAGTAQRLMNCGGYGVGDRAVILGSGDVGQIMARQLVQAGKQVAAIVEQRPCLGGLSRNRRDCVEAFHIPALLSSTVESLEGAGRLEGVTVRDLSTGERRKIACDTLITAVGLIPDRTLCGAWEGPLPEWLRLCGNCDYVHDMVERVTSEASRLGAEYGRRRI